MTSEHRKRTWNCETSERANSNKYRIGASERPGLSDLNYRTQKSRASGEFKGRSVAHFGHPQQAIRQPFVKATVQVVMDLAIGWTKASEIETKRSTFSTSGDNPLLLENHWKASYIDEALGKTLLVHKKGIIIGGDQEDKDPT